MDFPSGQPFLGAAAKTPPNNFWQAPGVNNLDARHFLSLGTCNGCHAREAFPNVTAVDDLHKDQPPPHFTHVRPRQAGKEAQLSFFLTGKDATGEDYLLPDPANQQDPDKPGQVKKRPFHDLANRAQDLDALVRYGAFYESQRLPLQRVH